MRLRTIKTIFAKEILDTLRDRRTLLFMIVIPVLLYPGIMIFLNELATSQQAKMEQRTVKIALIHVPENSKLRVLLKDETRIEIVESTNAVEGVKRGDLDYVLELPPNAEEILRSNGTATLQLHYDRSNDNATVNLDRVTKIVDQFRNGILKDRLKARDLSEEYFNPVKLEEVNEASKQKMGGFIIGRFLPMLMVIMVLAGSLYPAIDMTAGEKERGTLETILTSPATRTEIVIGKFLTVTLIALLTGLLNMGSMIGTFAFGIFKGASSALQINIPLNYVLIMVVCLVPLAVFFAGMMMTLASFARSFKEAQNLLTPVYLLGTMPAMISTIPGIELEGFWLTLPVANITLLFKELMLGTFNAGHIFVVFFTISFLACISLFMAIRLFGREEVLFGEVSSFGLAFKRVNITGKPLPTPPEALFFTMLALALLLYAGMPLQMKDIAYGVVLTEVLIFLALPIAYAAYLKLDLRETFRLRAPSPLYLLGAVLFFAGIECIAPTLVYWQIQVFPIPKDLLDSMEKLEGLLSKQSFAQTFLLLALMPAVCEETSFRGLIFSGLLSNSRPWKAILLTAFFFGVFHLSLHRFLPVFLIGIVATYLVWKSGSIFTGMLLHMLVNGWAAILIHYPQLDFTGMLAGKPSVLMVAAGVAVSAFAFWLTRKEDSPQSHKEHKENV
jgi:sodium transport system permease protein